MTEHWIDRLSDYIDDDMAPSERAALEAHLDECAACSSTLADLRDVVDQAASLENRPPERDLWPAIAARLEERGPVVVPLETRRSARSRYRLSLPQLAAAVLAALLIGVAGAWFAIEREQPGVPTVAEGPADPSDEPGTSPFVPVSESAGGVSYAEAVAELEAMLEQRRDRLDPETLRAVEQNLAIIDQAISEIRAALEQNPDDPYLNRHLATTMKRKVDVLRQATDAAL